MAKMTRPTSDAVEILHRRFYEGKPSRLKNLEEARANDQIARRICELRTAAGVTQAQLGKLIGTTASVICRLSGLRRPLVSNAAQDRSRTEAASPDSIRSHPALGVGIRPAQPKIGSVAGLSLTVLREWRTASANMPARRTTP